MSDPPESSHQEPDRSASSGVRENDHLVEPMYSALGEPAPVESVDDFALVLRCGLWCLGIAAGALVWHFIAG